MSSVHLNKCKGRKNLKKNEFLKKYESILAEDREKYNGKDGRRKKERIDVRKGSIC